MDLKPHCLQSPAECFVPSSSVFPSASILKSFPSLFFFVRLFKEILSIGRFISFLLTEQTPAPLRAGAPTALSVCRFVLGGKNGTIGFKPLRVCEPWRSTCIRRERRDQIPASMSLLCSLFLFCLVFFVFAHTTVGRLPEDFAHCKDEMDVIIVHCGFRLCAVKLWTVICWGKFLWKNWITWRACRKVIVHAQVLFRLCKFYF